MIFYLVLLLSTIALAFSSQFVGERFRLTICIAVVVILGTFATIRGFVGTDTYSYHLQFDQIQLVDRFDESALVTEPAFVLLGKIVDLFGGNSFAYVATIGVLQSILLILILCRLDNPSYFMIYYIPTLYLNFHYNILREGTALLILMLALNRAKEGGALFLLLLFSSAFFHYSSLLFIPLVLIYKNIKDVNYIYLAINLVILLVVGYMILVFLNDYIEFKASNYADESFIIHDVGIGFILQLFLYICLAVSLFKDNRLEMLLFAIPVIVIKIIGLKYPLLVRIEVFFQIALLVMLTRDDLKEWSGQLSRLALLILCCLNVYGVTTNLESNDNVYITDFEHNISTYVPYRTFLDEHR